MRRCSSFRWLVQGTTQTADEPLQNHLDLVWIFVCAALVFLMQAGFTALETGMVRAKNTINVALKNISDFVVAAMGFWLIGFALMFGDSLAGWIGTSGFMLNGYETANDYAFFIFQAMFVGTEATIVAVAERIQSSAGQPSRRSACR